jgi:hypothetical protein
VSEVISDLKFYPMLVVAQAIERVGGESMTGSGFVCFINGTQTIPCHLRIINAKAGVNFAVAHNSEGVSITACLPIGTIQNQLLPESLEYVTCLWETAWMLSVAAVDDFVGEGRRIFTAKVIYTALAQCFAEILPVASNTIIGQLKLRFRDQTPMPSLEARTWFSIPWRASVTLDLASPSLISREPESAETNKEDEHA